MTRRTDPTRKRVDRCTVCQDMPWRRDAVCLGCFKVYADEVFGPAVARCESPIVGMESF